MNQKRIHKLITSSLLFICMLSVRIAAQEIWSSVGPDSGSLITSLHFNENNDTLYAGSIEGFQFYSLSFQTWTSVEEPGWIGRTVWSLSTAPNHPKRVITGRENAFFKGYVELNENFVTPGNIVFSSQGGGFKDIRYNPDHPDTVYACAWHDITPGDLLKSTNGGTSWIQLTNYLHTAMTELEIDPNNPDIIYVSGDAQVTKSTDGGQTWVTAGSGLPSSLGVYCISVSPENSDLLLASNDNGIYRSTDGGNTWTLIDGNSCQHFAFHPNFPSKVAAITFQPYKLLVSPDTGATWVDRTDNFPGEAMIDLGISSEDDMLYIAAPDSGVYKRALQFSSLADIQKTFPENIILHQNYPNPFNPETTIPFELNRAAHIRFDIFDINGRFIKTLLDEHRIPGRYTINWNGRDNKDQKVASGFYIYSLYSEGYKTSKKALLVK